MHMHTCEAAWALANFNSFGSTLFEGNGNMPHQESGPGSEIPVGGAPEAAHKRLAHLCRSFSRPLSAAPLAPPSPKPCL
jgi:hypothetical protein